MAVFFIILGLFVLAALFFLLFVGLMSPFIIWAAWKKYKEQQSANKS